MKPRWGSQGRLLRGASAETGRTLVRISRGEVGERMVVLGKASCGKTTWQIAFSERESPPYLLVPMRPWRGRARPSPLESGGSWLACNQQNAMGGTLLGLRLGENRSAASALFTGALFWSPRARPKPETPSCPKQAGRGPPLHNPVQQHPPWMREERCLPVIQRLPIESPQLESLPAEAPDISQDKAFHRSLSEVRAEEPRTIRTRSFRLRGWVVAYTAV